MELVFVCVCDDGCVYADPETGDEHLMSCYAGQVIDVDPVHHRHYVGACCLGAAFSCGTQAVKCAQGIVKAAKCGCAGGVISGGVSLGMHLYCTGRHVAHLVCPPPPPPGMTTFLVPDGATFAAMAARANQPETITLYDKRSTTSPAPVPTSWMDQISWPGGAAMSCAVKNAAKGAAAALPGPTGQNITVSGTWDSQGRAVLVPDSPALAPYIAAFMAGQLAVVAQSSPTRAVVSVSNPLLAPATTPGQAQSAQQALQIIVAQLAQKYGIA